MQRLRDNRTFVAIVVFIAAWMLLFSFIDPARVVDAIGVENTYAVAFLLALFGGLSALTGTSFFAAIAAFAAGGADPLWLAVWGGLGIFASDTVFFLAASTGVDALRESIGHLSQRMRAWIERLPTWLVLVFVFIYIGFSPLPNDILMIALALAGFRYRTLAPVLLIGSFAIVFNAAYLGARILN